MIDTSFLASVEIFSSLTAAHLEHLAENFSVVTKNENDIIFRKGDPGDAIYIIQEGTVKITLKAVNGDELIVTVLHKGDFFGELTLFDQSPRTANAVVYDHATLLVMPRNKFIAFLKVHPDVLIAMLSIVGKRLRESNDFMEQQATRNVNDEMERELTFGERIADRFSELIGSWSFIIWFIVLMTIWIVLNIYTIFFVPVDPYPFILLNLILSCVAAIQAPVIMMSQGRQAKKDKLSADMDYKINMKAELQIQDIRANIDKINKSQVKLFREIRHDQSEMLKNQKYILEKIAGFNGGINPE